ncbi:DNA-processing protein DprA [Microbacterium memoriense]|uniref:DNA-processing protein DprA n=1 Tax=Microbacterium memoriense TaxID=2978350 RepID=A0ABT2PAD6_9MICO|nr:DNA-processing protein DprA [Microbacterium memoriense]MCT9001566.1 DNA-processing protein DprA [Microbacterium memoriense]
MNAVVPGPETARAALEGLVSPRDDAGVVTSYARAVWSTLTEPGDGVAGALVAAFGAVPALEIALGGTGDDVDTAERAGLTPAALCAGRARWLPRREDIGHTLAAARRAGVRLLAPEDVAWPTRLGDLGLHAPLCLWTLGDAAQLSPQLGVALVGARAASAYGEHVATELAAESAASGIAVFSGAAYGIDGAAHRGALSAEGSTIAVLAGGVDRPYPAGHRDLIDRVASRGVVVAEVPCGSSPTKWRFLARNRLIAALSDATVVVEAAWRSGALNTAHHAAELGRPLGAVPGAVTSAASAGCHRLLREVDAVCITGATDVRELLGLGGAGADDGGLFEAGEYTGERTRILDAVTSRSVRSTEEVARRSGMSTADAAALLGLFELEGIVMRRDEGWCRGAS